MVPYRIPILTRESEMWELGEERPDFVLRNMVGASIDVIVTKVERTANRAQRPAVRPVAASAAFLLPVRIFMLSVPALPAGCWRSAPAVALWTAMVTTLI